MTLKLIQMLLSLAALVLRPPTSPLAAPDRLISLSREDIPAGATIYGLD